MSGKKINDYPDLVTPAQTDDYLVAVDNSTPSGFSHIPFTGNAKHELKGDGTFGNSSAVVSVLPTVDNETGDSVIYDGSQWIYDIALVATDNGGTIITGWVRQFNGPVNAKWFGATGDGVTDDTTAIQDAIDVLQASTYGGTVYIPDGVYIISSELLITDTGGQIPVAISGSGRISTVLKYTLSTGNCIRVLSDHCVITDITIDTSQATSTATGIYLKDTSGSGPKGIVLGRVNVKNFAIGVRNDGFANSFNACNVYGGVSGEANGYIGFQDDGSSGHVKIENSFFTDLLYGIKFEGPTTHFMVSSSNIELCGTGIYAGASTAAPALLTVVDSHFEGNTTRDIRAGVGIEELVLTGCRFGGTNSRASNSITTAGSATGTRLIHLKGCKFVDEGSGSNTEVINVGQMDSLILDTPDGIIDGIARTNITLSTSARIQLHGNIGRQEEISHSSATALQLDFEDGAYKSVSMSDNITNLSSPLNLVEGSLYVVRFMQDAIGGRTISFGTSYKGCSSGDINTTANAATNFTLFAITPSVLTKLSHVQE